MLRFSFKPYQLACGVYIKCDPISKLVVTPGIIKALRRGLCVNDFGAWFVVYRSLEKHSAAVGAHKLAAEEVPVIRSQQQGGGADFLDGPEPAQRDFFFFFHPFRLHVR